MGGAADMMIQARYGYGRGRGPRRMHPRLGTTLPYGAPPSSDSLRSEGASFGGLSDTVADEMFGVNIPDEVFSTEMATLGRGVGAIGNSLRNLQRAGLQSVIPTAGGTGGAYRGEGFGVDVPDRLVNELSKYATTAQQDPLATQAPAGQRYQRKPPVLQNFPPVFGDIGDAAVAEMFGEDDEADEFGILGIRRRHHRRERRRDRRQERHQEYGALFGGDDEDDEDEDDDGGEEGSEKKGFSLKSLPHWVVPAAIGTAAAAGAVGLGLALTSKKRKAKKAQKEESFAGVGDEVVDDMFGFDEEDEELDLDAEEAYGDDPPQALAFTSGPSSAPQQLPVPQSAVLPQPPRASWHDTKQAAHDLYQAERRMDRLSDRFSDGPDSKRAKRKLGDAAQDLANARANMPVNSPAYGAYVPSFGAYLPAYGGVLPDASALQAFMASLPRLSASDLYNETVRFITTYVGKMKAFSNQGKFTTQYDRFKAAVRSERGFGPQAQSAANQGVDLVQQISGESVSPIDRQAMLAVARAQAPLILKGLG